MSNPFDHGYFAGTELSSMGFKAVGENVRIAKTCTIVGLSNIEIGSNVRIDGYCSIIAAGPAKLSIGSYVHIGGYCFLSAAEGIVLEDFSGLSQGVRLYSRTDDYSGEFMTNPTLPEAFTGVTGGRIELGRHVIVGSGTVILPGVTIGEGASVGALSLVTKSLEGWGVYFGAPARRIKARAKTLLELERRFLTEKSA